MLPDMTYVSVGTGHTVLRAISMNAVGLTEYITTVNGSRFSD